MRTVSPFPKHPHLKLAKRPNLKDLRRFKPEPSAAGAARTSQRGTLTAVADDDLSPGVDRLMSQGTDRPRYTYG